MTSTYTENKGLSAVAAPFNVDMEDDENVVRDDEDVENGGQGTLQETGSEEVEMEQETVQMQTGG